ncbi:hypothetical protein EBN03_07880 [Nocardia stercoris]|uniref:Uncharacterized protein n=1 Tax=Nocardia stercoris TaxID=2483361 RepID=A0A3M2L9N9_9NOCA|nr:hypothetical protein EBN03_07880 [Nocardia stercoris]
MRTTGFRFLHTCPQAGRRTGSRRTPGCAAGRIDGAALDRAVAPTAESAPTAAALSPESADGPDPAFGSPLPAGTNRFAAPVVHDRTPDAERTP